MLALYGESLFFLQRTPASPSLWEMLARSGLLLYLIALKYGLALSPYTGLFLCTAHGGVPSGLIYTLAPLISIQVT